MLLRFALAMALGGVLGLEREWRKKPAGLRTHMMVSLGAATFVLITLRVYASALAQGAKPDPIHVIEAVVGGLGFLGAGSIMRNGGSVEGLTTAGSIWLAGAVGLAAGFGETRIAAFAVLFGIIVLAIMDQLERRLPR
jgi:putative Mg2+ transporter-C (MgtC) family protein